MSETIDTVTVPAFPTYRARIVVDTDPQEPYDDGAAPIIRRDFDRDTWNAAQVGDVTSYKLDANLAAAAVRWVHDDDTFTRYARIFHGVTRVEWWETSRDGYTYLALDPADWREEVGASGEAVAAQDTLMPEWRAYVDGDTYGVIVEKSETWRNVDTSEEREDWTEVDSCFGFYGDADGYVSDRAREMIAEAAE